MAPKLVPLHPLNVPPLTFGMAETEAASDAWNFNCGPAAVCAVSGLNPSTIRPHLGDFESKGYTNPTLMYSILGSIGIKWRGRVNSVNGLPDWPSFGLCRIQWAGPWTRDGVPIAARYRKTHWVASHRRDHHLYVFDVNAMVVGGWITFERWHTRLVPWLLEQCEPKASGQWWITHALSILELP